MKYFFAACLILFICTSLLQVSLRAQEKEVAPPSAQIIEAKLGTNVQDRQLTGEDSTFTLNTKVYLWLKVIGGVSETLTVTWKHGERSYSAAINIGGSPWRTWVYKTAAIAGEWTVSVADSKGTVLREMSFKVQ